MSSTENFQNALEAAKEFVNFDHLYASLHLHPDWVSIIPEDRNWAILHQVVFSGNIRFLSQILALQSTVKNFNPLLKTKDGKTILEIAQMRTDDPSVETYIRKLMTLDNMLTHAKNGDWDECMKIVRAHPSYLNEKTPYRRYYVLHHIACVGKKQIYDQFEKIPNCNFAGYLLADNLSVVDVAKLHGQSDFAEYMRKKYPILANETSEPVTKELPRSEEDRLRKEKILSLMITQKDFFSTLEDEIFKFPRQESRNEVIKKLREETEIDKFRKVREKRESGETTATTTVAIPSSNVDPNAFSQTLTCPLTFEYFKDPGKRSIVFSCFKTHVASYV